MPDLQFILAQSHIVPALGIGTYSLHGDACITAIEDAIALGYRHIDTAQLYDNESAIGKALKYSTVRRQEIFITDKVWPTNFTKKQFIPSVEESLRKLKTDYIDLLLVHWPGDETTNDLSVDFLGKCLAKGYARSIGVSNYNLKQVERARSQAPIICNQVEYHPYLSQEKMLHYLKTNGMFLTAYRPLAMGKLEQDDTLQEIAFKYSRTISQIALRWLIQQEKVAVIPKASKPAHRISNLAVFDFSLEEEEMKAIFALEKNKRLTDPAWGPNWKEE